MTTLHKNALKLQKLLSVPDRWTTKESARNTHGKRVYPDDPAAVCWCLLGGVERVTNNKKEHRELNAKIRSMVRFSGTSFISEFNDVSQYADIKSFLVDLVESTK